MGFTSYSKKFFKNKLSLYESVYKNTAPKSAVYEAKILLKLLEDIRDERYNETYMDIDESCDAVNRLKSFIESNNEEPFVLNKYTISSDVTYETYEYDLESYLNLLEQKMDIKNLTYSEIPNIFYDVLSYSKDIFESSNLETSYCFLLRDTLLPYLAFKKWSDTKSLNVVPLFISRKFISFFENSKEELYNWVQDAIFQALDDNVKTFEQLKEHIRNSLLNAPKELILLISSIKQMLSSIPKKKILIIESGYIGTLPVLLSVIDNRIDFKMFTTIPYFYEVYKDKFFTYDFQKIRLFETIQCQDVLFKLSSISNDGRIKVVETSNAKVKDIALKELRTWNDLLRNG